MKLRKLNRYFFLGLGAFMAFYALLPDLEMWRLGVAALMVSAFLMVWEDE